MHLADAFIQSDLQAIHFFYISMCFFQYIFISSSIVFQFSSTKNVYKDSVYEPKIYIAFGTAVY